MSKTLETNRSARQPAIGGADEPADCAIGSNAVQPEPKPVHGDNGSAETAAGETGDVPSAAEFRSAIGFLRGEDNPFDIFVAAQSPDDDFFRFHAPEIHQEAQAKIRRAIEKYAEPNYRVRHQLYPTRTLLVRGARGAGKTHLLHAIQFRDDGQHDLLVRPRYFEKQYPFAEYVLKEIVRTLLSEEPDVPNPLRWAARQITRRLLVEAILSLSPHEWLEHAARPGTIGILIGRRWKKYQASQQHLVQDLNELNPQNSPLASCERHRLNIDTARALVAEHIARCEVGTRSVVRMRRSLLWAMFELGLCDRIEPLTAFLESGFADPGEGLAATRAALVDDLLRTLVELLAAVGVPVVIAFDNIERLLAPIGKLDAQVAQAFFSGLAQLIDGVPGILILLFVEDGLWIQCAQQAIDSFARDRLLLGIRMRDFGHVAELQLAAPTYQAIEAMVCRRMAPLRARIDRSDRLPALFPFESADLRAVAGHSSDVLRAALLRLRDRYDSIVLSLPAGQAMDRDKQLPVGLAATDPARPIAPATVEQLSQLQVEREVLQPKWDSAIARAMRRLEKAPYGSLAGELHAGLGRWLELFAHDSQTIGTAELPGSDWTLVRAETGITFGDHPTFGLLTIGHWQHRKDRLDCRVAVGLILGTGSSMPRDLAVKLSASRIRPPIADELVILWPNREVELDPCSLPPGSRKVWEERAQDSMVTLRGLPTADVVWLLAFNDWLNETNELGQPGWPEGAARRFLLARTRSVLDGLVPHKAATTE